MQRERRSGWDTERRSIFFSASWSILRRERGDELMAVVRTAGGIVWRPGARGVEVLLHRTRSGGWSLPKGAVARADFWHAALRAVDQQTRCSARILSFAGAWAEEEPGGLEIAFYWNMELLREGWEARTAWERPDEAIKEIELASERRLVARAWARRSLRRLPEAIVDGTRALCDARRVVTAAESNQRPW
jgi:hypothetical protein